MIGYLTTRTLTLTRIMYDSYPSRMMPILRDHFFSKKDVKDLCSAPIESIERHGWELKVKRWKPAYGDDTTVQKIKVYPHHSNMSHQEFMALVKTPAFDHIYVFDMSEEEWLTDIKTQDLWVEQAKNGSLPTP